MAGRFTQAAVKRAIKGVQDAGLVVSRVEIDTDGTIRVFTQHSAPPQEDWERHQPGLRRGGDDI